MTSLTASGQAVQDSVATPNNSSKATTNKADDVCAGLPDSSIVYKHVSKYAKANDLVAWWQLGSTMAVWFVMAYLRSWWLLIPFSLYNVRIFVLFHDMGHMSFFSSRKMNEIVGTIFGATLAAASLSHWNKGHNYHHKHANNLDKKLYSQTAPWSTSRYKAASPKKRLIYKFIFGHWTLFTVVPFLAFVVFARFVSKPHENVIAVAFYVASIYFGRLSYFMASAVISTALGFFLFHVQHSFDGAKRYHGDKWSYYEVGMKGSSMLLVPWWLKYFTAGIEYHHIHHLNSLVPNYKLRECHEKAGNLFDCVPKLTLLDALKTLSFSLYDENEMNFKSVYDMEF